MIERTYRPKCLTLNRKNNEMDNEEKYRSLYKNYKKLSEKIYKNK